MSCNNEKRAPNTGFLIFILYPNNNIANNLIFKRCLGNVLPRRFPIILSSLSCFVFICYLLSLVLIQINNSSKASWRIRQREDANDVP